MTKTKKKTRSTATFFALLKQMKGYNKAFHKECKEIEVTEFLKGEYGEGVYSVSLTALSDQEYTELIESMRYRLKEECNPTKMIEKAERREIIHAIIQTFSRIGVYVVNNDWRELNKHIRSLPISKGRIIPQIETRELPSLLSAVRAYCDNIAKKQKKEQHLANCN
ncbi:MAG: hypothetical protein LUE98_07645 [Tannerellaceae bacterium]|nr:hypothetical protein [Tannerellaceae bacterium]